MGENLTKATKNLKDKHNFANLIEECDYVNAVNEAIETLEGSGGSGGVTEQFVTDAIKAETDARTLADEALETGANNTFITKTDGADAIKDFVTGAELATALDTSSNFTAKDPSNSEAVTALDTILANIYAAPASRQTTLSPEQMKQIEVNILTELLKKMAK